MDETTSSLKWEIQTCIPSQIVYKIELRQVSIESHGKQMIYDEKYKYSISQFHVGYMKYSMLENIVRIDIRLLIYFHLYFKKNNEIYQRYDAENMYYLSC